MKLMEEFSWIHKFMINQQTWMYFLLVIFYALYLGHPHHEFHHHLWISRLFQAPTRFATFRPWTHGTDVPTSDQISEAQICICDGEDEKAKEADSNFF